MKQYTSGVHLRISIGKCRSCEREAGDGVEGAAEFMEGFCSYHYLLKKAVEFEYAAVPARPTACKAEAKP